jgi:spermidine synthase
MAGHKVALAGGAIGGVARIVADLATRARSFDQLQFAEARVDSLTAVVSKSSSAKGSVTLRVFAVIFFLSGATSLIYQVAWMRKLSLFFGSDVYSAAITLSAFMGGLCAGSWLSGRLGRTTKRPLFAYGLLEIGVACYAAAFSVILGLVDPWLSELYRETFSGAPLLYQVARAAVAFLVLLPPTALMGATLPLVVQHFAVADRVLGARLGHFYAMNTFGALAGAIGSGFVLLPVIGIEWSMRTAACVNLAIGLAAIGLAQRSGAVVVEPTVARRLDKGHTRSLVVWGIGISGFAALALEVVWMRVLVQSFSATVYAFSIMLACFLAGIAYGSEREAKQVDTLARPAERLIRLELALFAYVVLLAVLTYIVPGFFGIVLWGLTAATGGAFGVASIVAQAIAASLLIIAPTCWLGATFPLAVKIHTNDIRDRANDTGIIYSANTLGALAGALAAGFILIPLFGARNSLIAVGLLFLAAALVLNPLAERPVEPRDRMLRITAVGAGAVIAVIAMLLPQQILANFNMQKTTRPEVVYHGEGVAHTIDIIKTATGNTLMMVDGNVEADTTLLQRRHFILKAHLPLLLNKEPKDVAVIGLGLGITLAATARNPEVQHVRVIELTPEMVAAHRYLRDLTDDILANPKVNLTIDDGRNFLNRGVENFDMITADPIHPRITGVGYLYSREYYEAVRSHLHPGGYVLHWMPMYAISRQSFDVAFRTFASVFPHASFWYVRSHGLFVAGLEPFTIDYSTLTKRFEFPAVRRDFESIGIHSADELLAHMLMDEDHIAQYLSKSAGPGRGLNTDDNSYLEYATPLEYLHRTRETIEALKPFAGWDRKRLVGAGAADVEAIDKLFAERQGRLLEELELPVE